MTTVRAVETFMLFATDAAGEDASFEESAPTLSEARSRAAEHLVGTAVRLDPLPTTCPVRNALRKVRLAADGVRGAAALWEAQDQLCRDPDPDAKWLREREERLRDLAEAAGVLAKAADTLATLAAAGLPLREQLKASVKVEQRAAE